MPWHGIKVLSIQISESSTNIAPTLDELKNDSVKVTSELIKYVICNRPSLKILTIN